MSAAARGHVYFADLGYGERPFLCVSNDARNGRLGTFLAVRITASAKPDVATVVPLGKDDPVAGTVLCDDILSLQPDEASRDAGPVTPRTLQAVAVALRAALAV